MTKLQEKGGKPKPILVLYLCGGSRTRIRVFAKPASLGLASSRTGMLLGVINDAAKLAVNVGRVRTLADTYCSVCRLETLQSTCR